MEIRDEHVEYAVVQRLSKLLDEASSSEFPVTNSYALFVSILCWVLQRTRAQDRNLDTWTEEIDVGPWLISDRTSNESKTDQTRIGSWATIRYENDERPYPNIGKLLIALRNAVAHADHDRIKPIHDEKLKGCPERQLLRFDIICDPSRRVTVTLRADDMRRIGVAVAKKLLDKKTSDNHFADDSRSGVLERIA